MEQRKKIEDAINSLDGLQKAGPGPFFYTRVHARLQKEETGFIAHVAAYLSKPVVAFATLFLIFALNTAAFIYQHENAGAADQTDQSVLEDYNTTVASNSYYYENTDPR